MNYYLPIKYQTHNPCHISLSFLLGNHTGAHAQSHTPTREVAGTVITFPKKLKGFSFFFLRKNHPMWLWRLCAKHCHRHQPAVARVGGGGVIFGHAPVYILRVLRAGTKVTESGRFWFWSWPPLLWRTFCRCLSSWRFFFSCRCCSFFCLLDVWEGRSGQEMSQRN